jgi:elongation factor Ts
MAITLEQIKELRKKTGVGIHQVKEALEASSGDMEKAVIYLREKGFAKATKRGGNETGYGVIGSYIHSDKSLGVIVEVNAETDFAARNERLMQLANEIAIHIAAADPQYLNIEDVPLKIVDDEKAVFKKEVEGKPENVQEKILEGKMMKFYEENVLMEQSYVKDDSKKIKDLVNDAVAAIGEKIDVGRFARIKIAGPATACGLDLSQYS